MKLYQPPISRIQTKLNKKLKRLEELKRQYQAATNNKSRASFKGKITRCQKDIESLKAKIKRLEHTAG